MFPTEPGEFPLADWFETFDYDERARSNRIRLMSPLITSSEAWRARSHSLSPKRELEMRAVQN